MKFTLAWLKEHLDTAAELTQICDTLTRIGLEVEAVNDPAAQLADFQVAEIITVQPHPDADKLKLCTVKTATEELQVVCGAPNARQGLRGIFAPVGATIPANGMVLSKAKIRGVESFGMLCSAAELDISDEHDGIIELDLEIEIGTPAAQALGRLDPMIEIGITPNRPDCLGVRGIARDLAAAGLGTLKPEKISAPKGDAPCPIKIMIDGKACTRFAGRMISGVKNQPSPQWLQDRLTAIGLRPINALVDITNYISYDQTRPLHVYDADKLNGNISARLAQAGETFTALDEKDYRLTKTDCVIADESGVLGLAGIMGGLASGSTDETVNVFIESAYFDPITVAQAGRHHNIVSDARYRFERGIDPDSVETGLALATQMIIEICGGTPSQIELSEAPHVESKSIKFTPSLTERLTGIILSDKQMQDILTALGFAVKTQKAHWQVTPPSWRPDIEGAADLVEDIARIHGLEHVPATPLPRLHEVAQPILTVPQKRARAARRALAACGMMETVTYSFVSEEHARLFTNDALIMLANPISSELSAMRPSLLPSLLAAAERNQNRGFHDLALFEIGAQFIADAPHQINVYAGLRTGDQQPRHWQAQAQDVDLFCAKQDALSTFSALGIAPENIQTDRTVPDYYHPGRAGRLFQNPRQSLGYFGELHPRIISAFNLSHQAVAFEIFPDALPAPKQKDTNAKAALHLASLQTVTRDLAFEVDTQVEATQLLKAIRSAEKKYIQNIRLFDLFTGGNLAEQGKKSLAFEITLQPQTTSLTDSEIDAIMTAIIDKVVSETGAQLRG